MHLSNLSTYIVTHLNVNNYTSKLFKKPKILKCRCSLRTHFGVQFESKINVSGKVVKHS